jgi:tRNA pseudouridine55 synthase
MTKKLFGSGIFAVYKPKGPSSFDIIRKLKKQLGEKRIGHAGTLDPLASGILVVAVGRENTKKLPREVKKEKEYVAEIKLGEMSTTDDGEGEKQKIAFGKKPNREELEAALKKFIGKIKQTPPAFSAVKVKGRRAYSMARKGERLELAPREVMIKSIELLSFNFPLLKLRVVTGPGVYIRSLTRDIGEALGAGAYLANLERVRVGEFTKDDAFVIK